MRDEADLYRAFDTDPAPIVEFLRWVAAAHGLPEPPRVLDVGCGPGRLFGPLSELGWHVVGMEPNEAFFAHAQAVAGRLRNVEVRRGGFNDVAAVEAFDLVVGINSSFSHVATPRERVDALARAFRALRPGGCLFLDLPNLLRVLREWAGPFEHKAEIEGRPVTLIRQHEVNYHTATFTTLEEYVSMDEAGREVRFRKEHPYAITPFPELEFLLRGAGFGEIRTFGSYEAREVEPVGPGRMMLVASKPSDSFAKATM